MKHSARIRAFLLTVSLAFVISCGNSVTSINTIESGGTRTGKCTFEVLALASVVKDSGQVVSTLLSDEQLSTPNTFTYRAQPSTKADMDTLMNGLCAAGFNILEAVYVTEYVCKDAIGPKAVVVLTNADQRIFGYGEGFVQGASGRLSCANAQLKYSPK